MPQSLTFFSSVLMFLLNKILPYLFFSPPFIGQPPCDTEKCATEGRLCGYGSGWRKACASAVFSGSPENKWRRPRRTGDAAVFFSISVPYLRERSSEGKRLYGNGVPALSVNFRLVPSQFRKTWYTLPLVTVLAGRRLVESCQVLFARCISTFICSI